jgi:hypothetical protein
MADCSEWVWVLIDNVDVTDADVVVVVVVDVC